MDTQGDFEDDGRDGFGYVTDDDFRRSDNNNFVSNQDSKGDLDICGDDFEDQEIDQFDENEDSADDGFS